MKTLTIWVTDPGSNKPYTKRVGVLKVYDKFLLMTTGKHRFCALKTDLRNNIPVSL